MKKSLRFTMLVAVLAMFGAMTVQAAVRVQVCHRPPGNFGTSGITDNFHTITVPDQLLSKHLAHGDIAGSCSQSCDTLCDDGDACTQDYAGDCEESGCLTSPTPVDCDDSDLCTSDSCDSQAGCQYASIVCDDGDNCTVDTCNPADGQCTATEKDCGTLGVCLSETGDCDYPCDGITCGPIDQCHESGTCVLPGDCVDGAALADGTPCDDGDAGTANDQCNQGMCSGTPVFCPCDFSDAALDTWFASGVAWCMDLTDADENGNSIGALVTVGNPTPFAASPVAIVEYTSEFNLPADVVQPACGVVDFAVYDADDYTSGISVAEAEACVAQLRTWIVANGLICS
jgi:hypothetical protein